MKFLTKKKKKKKEKEDNILTKFRKKKLRFKIDKKLRFRG